MAVDPATLNLVQQHVRSLIGLCYLFFWGSIAYNVWKFIFFETPSALDILNPGRRFMRGAIDMISQVPGFRGVGTLNRNILPDNMLSTEDRIQHRMVRHYRKIKSLIAARHFEQARKALPAAKGDCVQLMDLDDDMTSSFKGAMNQRIGRIVKNAEDQKSILIYLQNIFNGLEQALLMAVQTEESLEMAAALPEKDAKKKERVAQAQKELQTIEQRVAQFLQAWGAVIDAMLQKHAASLTEADAYLQETKRQDAEEAAAKKAAEESKAKSQKAEAKQSGDKQ